MIHSEIHLPQKYNHFETVYIENYAHWSRDQIYSILNLVMKFCSSQYESRMSFQGKHSSKTDKTPPNCLPLSDNKHHTIVIKHIVINIVKHKCTSMNVMIVCICENWVFAVYNLKQLKGSLQIILMMCSWIISIPILNKITRNLWTN